VHSESVNQRSGQRRRTGFVGVGVKVVGEREGRGGRSIEKSKDRTMLRGGRRHGGCPPKLADGEWSGGVVESGRNMWISGGVGVKAFWHEVRNSAEGFVGWGEELKREGDGDTAVVARQGGGGGEC